MWHKQPCREGTHIFLVVTFFRVSYWYSEKDATNDSFAQLVSTRSINSSKKINLSDPRVNFEIKEHCNNFFRMNFSRFSNSFWIMSRLFREIYEDRFWKLEICSNFAEIFQKLAPHVFQQETVIPRQIFATPAAFLSIEKCNREECSRMQQSRLLVIFHVAHARVRHRSSRLEKSRGVSCSTCRKFNLRFACTWGNCLAWATQ